MDIVPLHSYFPRYTLLSESIISKEDIGNYQLLNDFDRTENAKSAFSKILIYNISQTTLLQPDK